MPDNLELIHRVEPETVLAANLSHMARKLGFDQQEIDDWIANGAAHALVARAVGLMMRGYCTCPDRFRFPLGRVQDFKSALVRCERQHGITVADLIKAGFLTPPLEIACDYLDHHLQATITATGKVHFGGQDYPGLFSAARAARESATGPWVDADYGQFWQYQDAAGRWVRIDPAHPPVAEILQLGMKLRGEVLGQELWAEIGENGEVWFNGQSSETFAKAADGARESVVQDRAKTNGWTFWKYSDPEKKEGVPLDAKRKAFWKEFLLVPNAEADAWWKDHTAGPGLNQFLKSAVVGGSFPAHARDITRTVSFRWISMPDEQGLEWGDVLFCALPDPPWLRSDTAGLNWPEFVNRIVAGPVGSRTPFDGNAVQALIAISNRDLMRQLTAAAGPDLAKHLSQDPMLKKALVDTMNNVLTRTDWLEEAKTRRFDPGWEARERLGLGIPPAGHPDLVWLNRRLLAAAYPDLVPEPPPPRNGCGQEVLRECSLCRNDPNKKPIPVVLNSLRIFLQERRTPREAFHCAQCGNYWIPNNPLDSTGICPRCITGRPTMNGPNPRTTTVWVAVATEGNDQLDCLEIIGDDLD